MNSKIQTLIEESTMKSMKFLWMHFLCIALLLAVLSKGAGACPYSIRDAGFIVRDPKAYELVFVVHGDKERNEALTERVAALSREILAGANVAASAAALNSDSAPRDKMLLERLDAGTLPEAVLVPRDGQPFLIRTFPSDAITDDELRATMRQAVMSPKREEISKHLIDCWCVVVMVDGPDAADNERAVKVIKTASKRIVGKSTEMGTRIQGAPYFVRLKRGEEKLLQWSLGFTENDKFAQIAVVFGAGRRLGPVLRSPEISENVLTEIFQVLGRNCTCTSDASSILGPCIPMIWGRANQLLVRDRLGFDPSSPAAMATLSGAWKDLATGDTKGAPLSELLGDTGVGYVEFTLGPEGKDAESKAEHLREQVAVASDKRSCCEVAPGKTPRVSMPSAEPDAAREAKRHETDAMKLQDLRALASRVVTKKVAVDKDSFTQRGKRVLIVAITVIATLAVAAVVLIVAVHKKEGA